MFEGVLFKMAGKGGWTLVVVPPEFSVRRGKGEVDRVRVSLETDPNR